MSHTNHNSINMSLKDYHDKWMYSFAMLFHKTIYNHAAWNAHRSNLRHCRQLLRLAGFPLWPPVVILTIYSALLAAYNEEAAHHSQGKLAVLCISSKPLTFTAAALIVLLGFRTNACYGRFYEARKIWGANLNRGRDLARQACTWMDSKEDEKIFQSFIQYLKAFPYCMKENIEVEGRLHDELFGILDPHDLEVLLASAPMIPNHCCQVLSELLAKSHMSEIMKAFVSQNIQTFVDNTGMCERLFKTPISLSYTHLTSQFLVVWHIILPLAIWDACGWLVVPATFLSAAALFCIDEVGIQIEEPFSILPLQAICDGICNNIEHIKNVHERISKLKCLNYEVTIVESLKKELK
jgi:putative membrane protein